MKQLTLDIGLAPLPTLANFDPSRDMVLLAEHDRVGFACAPKALGDERNGQPVRPWPPVVAMSVEATARAVELAGRPAEGG